MVDSEEPKFRGVVSEVGLERDGGHFRSFNLKIGVVVKAGKRLGYEEGERMMRRFRKELLGKDVEVITIMVHCPICGKGFNTEQGMNQHKRMMHGEKKAKRTRKAAPKRKPKKTKSRRKPGGT